jgi:lipopolysaccharide export system protein LptA
VVVFVAAYVVYAHFLGGIDGLPPLPPDYVAHDTPILPILEHENYAIKKLRMAFGEDCPEKDWKIQIESQDKGFVLATRDVTVLPDGRLELEPFSFVLFRKDKEDGKYPEIDTVRSKKAFLSFDKPVSSIADIASRKIVGGMLGTGADDDEIFIINNRRTPQRDDDICLFTRGPVYYEEARHQIWTMADVRLTDPQSKPKPMEVTGTGMDIYLTAASKAAPQPAVPQRKSNSGAPSGVERIVLRSNVGMNLWIDSRSGFLGGAKNTPPGKSPKAAPPAINQKAGRAAVASSSSSKALPLQAVAVNAPDSKGVPLQEQKAKLVIVTQGPFEYDPHARKAVFDIAKHSGPRPNVVSVDRFIDDKLDHLTCDRLELQFQQAKAKETSGAVDDELEGMDIDSVRAIGKEVILTSDAEILEAHGTDFFYNRRTQQSVLKGEPWMWALKEGNQIEARELQLVDQKGAQQATALGEGRIRLLDKNKGTRPLEARWTNKLVYGKDGAQDLLTLFGNAAFIDHDNDQQLHADVLKVWLEPTDPNVSAGSDQPKRRPQRVDALGRVTASSPDLRVHDTETLVLYFKDRPGALPPPVASPGSDPSQPVHVSGKPPNAEGAPMLPRRADGPSVANPLQTAPADPTKAKRPIYLCAHQVTAHILRDASRNDLERLWCEGAVHVQQEPASPQDKGVDIRGAQLDLAHHIEGNILTVIGDNAQVQLNKIFILGPQINLDQTTNEAWVTGMGIMRMPSKDSFDGAPLARETELTINWEKSMLFDGQLAKFRGSILAEQDGGHLACQELDVWLDRKMSLREGEKGNQPAAKVQKLLCEKDVWIEDLTKQDQRAVSYKRMECFQLSLDNDTDSNESIVNASGPGRVRIFSVGTKTELLPGLTGGGPAKPQAAPAAAPSQGPRRAKPGANTSKDKEETTLTHVAYEGRMTANNRKGSATFWDNVQVFYVPTNDPELKINLIRPPEGYMYLRCNKLEVFNHKLADGRSFKEMRASSKANVEGKEFSGSANEIKYDESKEQIILEGSEDSPAVLYREKVKGGERESLRGQKIIYWRTNGTFHVENGRGMIGGN